MSFNPPSATWGLRGPVSTLHHHSRNRVYTSVMGGICNPEERCFLECCTCWKWNVKRFSNHLLKYFFVTLSATRASQARSLVKCPCKCLLQAYIKRFESKTWQQVKRAQQWNIADTFSREILSSRGNEDDDFHCMCAVKAPSLIVCPSLRWIGWLWHPSLCQYNLKLFHS